MERSVLWEGLHNARDLGGLPVGQAATAFGKFYRAPRLDVLTDTGWGQLVAAGVRTLVDLRNLDEVKPLPVPAGVMRHHRPVEDQSDAEFMAAWAEHLNSPVYYADVLARWPDKVAGVFRCFLDAPEGGIVFHCSAGRDRTGMITALLLDLAGVPVDSIVEDYLVSVVIMNDYHGRHQPDVEPILQGEALQAWMLKVGDHLRQFLRERPCAEFLTQCGFSPGELETVKGRLI